MHRSALSLFVAIASFFGADLFCELKMVTNALYFTGGVGAAWNQDQIHHQEYNFRIGPVASLSVGYKSDCGFRFEVEYAYRYNRFSHVKVYHFSFSKHGYLQTSAGLFNILYDFYLPDTYAIPYMGIGLGVSNQRLIVRKESLFENSEKNSLAWQAILGLDYMVNSFNRAGVAYKFFRGASHKVNSHSVYLTWTYFP